MAKKTPYDVRRKDDSGLLGKEVGFGGAEGDKPSDMSYTVKNYEKRNKVKLVDKGMNRWTALSDDPDHKNNKK